MLETALTAVAVVLALAQPVPQVVRILRDRSIAGVSGSTTWLGFVINAAWASYGVGRGVPAVVVVSITYALGYALIGALLIRGGNVRGLVVGAASMLALVALTLGTGWVVLGAVLALTVAVQFLPQVLEAWRADDLSGLAPGTYVVCAVDGAVWGGIGLAVVDPPLVLYGAVMLTVAALVLVPRRRWARRVAVVTA